MLGIEFEFQRCRRALHFAVPIFLAGATLQIGSSVGCAQLVPVGEETLVNSLESVEPERPVADIDGLGRFVVVWESRGSLGSDSSGPSIQARLFTPEGRPVGDQFQVNTLTTERQYSAAVAFQPNGDFVVVWSTESAGYPELEIAGQRFAPDGSPLGGEFQVNTYTSGIQGAPAVTVAPTGDFLVVWTSAGSVGNDEDGFSIQGQYFDAGGQKTGSQFQVNSFTTSNQYASEVASLGTAFVVTWANDSGSPGNDDVDASIQARILDSPTPTGLDFQVNSYTTNRQYRPRIASGDDGRFAVVWDSGGSSGTDEVGVSIQAQVFASDGSTIGSEFQVNTFTTSSQNAASAAFSPGGDLVIAWTSGDPFTPGPDGDIGSIQLQAVAADGAFLGDEFTVNTYTTGDQFPAWIASNNRGEFVVVWQSSDSPSGNEAAFLQRLEDPNVSIFEDNFEGGSTEAWSLTVGEGKLPKGHPSESETEPRGFN